MNAPLALNYRHLHYFWVVAKEGGVTRAANRLGVAVQTISTQVHELERALGHVLLKTEGRNLVLTDAGRVALRQADAIFHLGEQLPSLMQDAADIPTVRLMVGVSDSLPKLVVRHLMEPVMREPSLRLTCDDDEFEDLLADLALHRLDVVLSDRPAPTNPNLKLYSHLLAASPLGWYAAPALAAQVQGNFPHCLAQLPVLLPTQHAVVRGRIERWFEQLGLRPRVVGEFEDSALLKTFGAGGMGVFPAPELVHEDLVQRYGVQRIGHSEGVDEHFYAIAADKKIKHPLVLLLMRGAAPREPAPAPAPGPAPLHVPVPVPFDKIRSARSTRRSGKPGPA
jgi:LysR family transcriptional regulator, transcriptional activator of nhaA